MTTALWSRGIGETVARVIWLSIASPRQAVRELLAAKDAIVASWIISVLGVLVSSFTPSFFEWLKFLDPMRPLESTYFAFKLSLWLSMVWDLFGAVILAILIPIIILIWVYVFGFRDKSRLVWMAMAVSLAMSIILEPVFGLATYLFKIPDDGIVFGVLLAAQLAIALLLCANYYSEALSIKFGKSILLNLGAAGMLIVPVVIIAIAALAIVGIDGIGSAP
ncbi:MAG: hypothetical protein ABL936_17200 [Aestuariivirga sp.]